MSENYAEQAKVGIPADLLNHLNIPMRAGMQVMICFTHTMPTAEVLATQTAPWKAMSRKR